MSATNTMESRILRQGFTNEEPSEYDVKFAELVAGYLAKNYDKGVWDVRIPQMDGKEFFKLGKAYREVKNSYLSHLERALTRKVFQYFRLARLEKGEERTSWDDVKAIAHYKTVHRCKRIFREFIYEKNLD